jgi:hypothetical protein
VTYSKDLHAWTRFQISQGHPRNRHSIRTWRWKAGSTERDAETNDCDITCPPKTPLARHGLCSEEDRKSVGSSCSTSKDLSIVGSSTCERVVMMFQMLCRGFVASKDRLRSCLRSQGNLTLPAKRLFRASRWWWHDAFRSALLSCHLEDSVS